GTEAVHLMFAARQRSPEGLGDLLRVTASFSLFSDISYAPLGCILRFPLPRNIAQNAIILPTQTFNFAKSYTDATSMYVRATFPASTILVPVAMGTPPA
ncbi:hypothetical protein, partial [Pseudomonas putida]|uniref:hypothetical protein n=1 Tax=Pseudomonas putida TaxID=303 RepID=UPI003905983C